MTMISEREAATRLATATALTRTKATAVLHTGIAGQPAKVGSVHAYDAAAVDRIAWPPPMRQAVAEQSRTGAVIIRLWGADLGRLASNNCGGGDGGNDGHPTLAGAWPLGLLQRLELAHGLNVHGVVAGVATVCGFVVAGAEITAVTASSTPEITSAPAGDWYAGLHGRRLALGRGPTCLVDCYPYRPDGRWEEDQSFTRYAS